MAKKTKISSRIDKLFKNIDQAPNSSAAPENKVEIKPDFNAAQTARSFDTVFNSAPPSVPESANPWSSSMPAEVPAYAVEISPGTNHWASLRVVDESGNRTWSAEEELLIEQVMDQLSLALENSRLFQESKDRASELALINRVIGVLTASTNLEKALGVITREIVEAFPVARGAIAILNEDKNGYTVVAEHSKLPDSTSAIGFSIPIAGNPATQFLIKNQKPYAIDDPSSSASLHPSVRAELGKLGIKYSVLFPILADNQVAGTLGVDMVESGTPLNDHQIKLIESALGSISTSMARLAAETNLLRFKQGIETSGDAVFMTDPGGRIIFANPAFEKVYGYTQSEVIGKTPRIIKSGFIPQEQYQVFWGKLLSRETITGELINKAKDGRLVYIAGTNSPIVGENGNILGFLAVHHDISDRKRTEEELQKRNNYLSASAEIGRLVTSTLDLTTIFSRTVNLVNEKFGFYHAAIFTVEETRFHAIFQEGTGPVGREMKARNHRLPIDSGSIVGKVTMDGLPMVVNDVSQKSLHKFNPLLPETKAEAAIPLRIGSRIIGALDVQSKEVNAFSSDEIAVLQILADQVAVAIDNARSFELSQKAVMEMREVDRLKSQFLANMSHELRTPLNSIIGFSRVIIKGIDGPVTELQQQDLTAIYNSGQHLLGLINDILDLAKIEAGKMDITFDEVNLTEIINSVFSTMSGLIKGRPIELRKTFETDLPTVRGDAIRIRQILINLISNAVKFTDQGEIAIHAERDLNEENLPMVKVSVKDTGIGISKEDQEKLFQAFSQVDSSPTRKTGGTGLGLSICHQLVSIHNGRIWVDSEPGKGSGFHFTLPVYQPSQANPTPGS